MKAYKDIPEYSFFAAANKKDTLFIKINKYFFYGCKCSWYIYDEDDTQLVCTEEDYAKEEWNKVLDEVLVNN